MFIDPNPFPYLKYGQYAGTSDGNILFLDKSIPEEKKEWLRKEYKKWWKEKLDNEYINLPSTRQSFLKP